MLHLIDGKSPYLNPKNPGDCKDVPFQEHKITFKFIKVYDASNIEDSEDLAIFFREYNKMMLRSLSIWDMSNRDFKQIHFIKQNHLFDGFTLSFSNYYNGRMIPLGNALRRRPNTTEMPILEAIDFMSAFHPTKEVMDLREKILFEGYLDRCERTVYTFEVVGERTQAEKDVMDMLMMVNWGEDKAAI
ncbi:MAG: hypothetical protein LKE33_13000 [Acidaminococcus sp.]|jgi:hypothetical protein|nr:hypothetical protein [Acidaminococcus sp.]MCI2100720.1 hypothetical protein [Acidaminococcus sp.]MCI2115041.1 hypothetical protein [Acidaminococcus sp.]MCI2117117.1 hypothetical protein [Acidaminococcus sp.]